MMMKTRKRGAFRESGDEAGGGTNEDGLLLSDGGVNVDGANS